MAYSQYNFPNSYDPTEASHPDPLRSHPRQSGTPGGSPTEIGWGNRDMSSYADNNDMNYPHSSNIRPRGGQPSGPVSYNNRTEYSSRYPSRGTGLAHNTSPRLQTGFSRDNSFDGHQGASSYIGEMEQYIALPTESSLSFPPVHSGYRSSSRTNTPSPATFEETEEYLRRTLGIHRSRPLNLDALPDVAIGSKHPKIPDLITLAIWGSRERKLTLRQIYAAIEDRYPALRDQGDKPWQRSIRHNLSLKAMFVRVERPSDHRGQGHYWTLDITQGEGNKRDRRRRDGTRGLQGAPDGGSGEDSEDMSSDTSEISQDDQSISPHSPPVMGGGQQYFQQCGGPYYEGQSVDSRYPQTPSAPQFQAHQNGSPTNYHNMPVYNYDQFGEGGFQPQAGPSSEYFAPNGPPMLSRHGYSNSVQYVGVQGISPSLLQGSADHRPLEPSPNNSTEESYHRRRSARTHRR